MADTNPRDRKFETLFDGDEIEGKFYGLEAGVTGLDTATAEYLIRAGRIAEVDDERFSTLKGPGKPDSQAEGGDDDEDESEDDAGLEAAQARFDGGNIDADLLNPGAGENATDKLIARAELDKLATDAGATVKSGSSKADVAVAIMAARAKANG